MLLLQRHARNGRSSRGGSMTPILPIDPELTKSWREFQTTKLYDVLAAAPVVLIFGASGAHVAKGLLATLLQTDFSSFDPVFAISFFRQAMGLVLLLLLMTFLILRNPA